MCAITSSPITHVGKWSERDNFAPLLFVTDPSIGKDIVNIGENHSEVGYIHGCT